MACLLGCLALSVPRFVIILVVLFSDYIGTAFQSFLWPLLGFFMLPLTTLAYAWAIHSGDGHVSGVRLVFVVIALLVDLGTIGNGAKQAKAA